MTGAASADRGSPAAPPPDRSTGRLLMLTRYGDLGSSSRVRGSQFVPALRRAGWRVERAGLLDDAYVRRLYETGGRRPDRLAWAYLRRAARLLGRADHDLIWVEKELLPFVPYAAERALFRGRPYVVDYDDATFHTYDTHRRAAVRRVFGRKVDRLMRGARTVVAGNGYLAARARTAGARHIEVLPSVVDLDCYGPVAPLPEGPFTIGWIGSPGSQRVLHVLRDVLAREAARPDTRVVLVGVEGRPLGDVPVEVRPWSGATEVAEMGRFHVGIMPLPDEPWERGKCGFKLVQCMAAGRPVVASPVGVNAEIVTDGWNGFLADGPDAWHAAFDRLRADRSLGQTMGERGRARVRDGYSLASVAPRLDATLREAAGLTPGAPRLDPTP
ncbi:glycosyltransferase family 4 protein [Rubrivirga sp. S365]|uniref:Glycosyltransferase family 4 protein n=1 Tax=Rubrivirga litoralis TaxID=3075598 RepID=A0ABU3BRB0_9BACT|nr:MULTISPECIES: glycosyltransferase family 4 protein [unclassified Rubrivirga]MDT0631809.1 glycosyltransferase family 4 protein [Rubrivirga sp. F394]MDT7856499.1 glycosyltransferase family 4 protein [Rubrivirga sp. S365]